MRRLFAALELPEHVRSELVRMSHGLPGARWVSEDRLHLTLRFFGELNDEATEALLENLRGVYESAFEFSLAGVGQFLNGKSPASLWVGVEPNPELERLQSRIEKAATASGLGRERRKFFGHVTLARLRGVNRPRLEQYLREYSGFGLPEIPAREFLLIESRLRPEGPLYSILEAFPLGPGIPVV